MRKLFTKDNQFIMYKKIATKRNIFILIAILIGVVVIASLYQDTQGTAAFTAQLDALAQDGPEVVADGEVDVDAVSEDVAAIQSIIQETKDAWCAGDGTAYAAVFTQHADFISFDGTHTIGREVIADSHQELFDRFMANTCLRGYVKRIKFLNEQTAIVYVVGGTRFDGREIVRRPSIQTYVAVKHNDDWFLSTFHNGRIDRVEERSLPRLMWLAIETFVLRR